MGDPVTMGVKLALTAASMALTMSQKFEGPRLDTLDVTTADPMTPIPDIYGYKRNDSCSIIHAEKLREKKVESKTKGGKYTNYKYYGTWKNILAGHPIDSVAKIRFDRKIVYDATKKGPISSLLGMFEGFGGGSPVKLAMGRNFRINLGLETDLPHPRYAAWCEDRYGPDSAPANRGTANMDFIDIPLEKIGNRIPQVSADIVRVKTPAYLSDTVDAEGGVSFSPDFLRFELDSALWDTPTREKIVDLDFDISAFGSSGTLWEIYDFINPLEGVKVVAWANDGQTHRDPVIGPTGAFVDGIQVVPNIGEDNVFLIPYDSQQNNLIQLVGDEVTTHSINFSPSLFLRDASANLYAIGRQFSGGTGIWVANVTFLREGVSGTEISTSSTAPVSGWLNSEGNWVLLQGGTAYLVDPETLAVIDSVAGSFDTTDISADNSGTAFWSVSGSTAVEYSMLDLSVLRSINLTLWGGSGLGGTYDPINHAIVQRRSGADTRWLYLDRIADDSTINLSDILEIECGLAGVSEITYTGTDPVIQGYLVTQGPVSDRIGPLLEIHDLDARPHDFGIEFLVRGTAATESIDSSEFVKDGDIRWQAPITQDVDLTQRMTFGYADKGKDQQTNTASAQRSQGLVNSNRVKSVDMTTYVSDPEEAQPIVERKFRREWFEREGQEFSLQLRHSMLEPGDIRQIVLDDNPRTCRLVELTKSGGLLNTKWLRDDPRVHDKNASAGPTLDGRDEEELYIAGPVKAFVLDTPLHEDIENTTNVLLHYGIGTYGTSSFPGGTIYQLDPVENEYAAWEEVGSSEKGTWGYAADALVGFSPSTWDERNSVTIRLKGSLVSRTQDEIDADPTINLAYLGDEYGNGELLNFADAVLNGDGTWTLSTLKRGRRGTEWAIDTHAIGDLFVLGSSLKEEELGVDEIGETITFKGQADGRTLDGAPEIPVPIVARSLKPYAPTALTAVLDGSDWDLGWTRRTRVGGNWSSGTSIPLGETTEAYKARILDENGDVVRTIDVTSPSTTYTAAQQTTDFGGAQTALHWTVCQVGDAVEGFQAEMRVGFPASVRAAGVMVSTPTPAAGVTATMPDYEAGDLLFLACQVDGTSTVTTPAGYEALDPESNTNSKLYVFWKRAGFGEGAPLVIGTGTILNTLMVSVEGAVPLGSPFDVTSGGSHGGSAVIPIDGLTTTLNNALILDFASVGNDVNGGFSSPSNASLVGYASVAGQSTNTGGGGGLWIGKGVKAAAGAVSASSVTFSESTDGGQIKVAIKPA